MSAYYEIIFGSGFYECYRYVIKTDYPTTDYGALTDVLIDYLADNSKEIAHRNIIINGDYTDIYEGSDHYIEDPEEVTFYEDQYVIGGNYGDVLIHYGDFRINEISETEIKDAKIIEA